MGNLVCLCHVQVYMFSRSKQKAEVFLNYHKAQVIVDGRHRARLVINVCIPKVQYMPLEYLCQSLQVCMHVWHAYFWVQDMDDLYCHTVQYSEKPFNTAIDTAMELCLWCSCFAYFCVPVWLIFKSAKANDPDCLHLSHHGGRRDDPRGEQNRVIAAPPSHTSV